MFISYIVPSVFLRSFPDVGMSFPCPHFPRCFSHFVVGVIYSLLCRHCVCVLLFLLFSIVRFVDFARSSVLSCFLASSLYLLSFSPLRVVFWCIYLFPSFCISWFLPVCLSLFLRLLLSFWSSWVICSLLAFLISSVCALFLRRLVILPDSSFRSLFCL